MEQFPAGLFAGQDEVDQVRDNLDLELVAPLKGIEHRIHGHRTCPCFGSSKRSTTALAFGRTQAHRGLFTVDDLLPYHSARACPNANAKR